MLLQSQFIDPVTTSLLRTQDFTEKLFSFKQVDSQVAQLAELSAHTYLLPGQSDPCVRAYPQLPFGQIFERMTMRNVEFGPNPFVFKWEANQKTRGFFVLDGFALEREFEQFARLPQEGTKRVDAEKVSVSEDQIC